MISTLPEIYSYGSVMTSSAPIELTEHLMSTNLNYTIHNESCYGLRPIEDDSVDALVTDPPYGINFQNHAWDKALPDARIWSDSLRVLKPGSFGLVFSSVRLMHRLMVNLEDAGFIIRDVIMWGYLNGMPKSRDVSLDIDRALGVPSQEIGHYQYVPGYRTAKRKQGSGDHYLAGDRKKKLSAASPEALPYRGAGLGIKPCYEPIILVQKPPAAGRTIAENLLAHGTGALNLEETRIPLPPGESPVGHNPHPLGRVCANQVRTVSLCDGYDKFFMVPKVRQHKDSFNHHPTVKPVALMDHLVKLVSFSGQLVLDPFAGSGSTGVAALGRNRRFLGYEIKKDYFDIMEKRFLPFPEED